MDFGRYLAIAITVVAFMFGLWILLQVLGVVTTGLNQATNQIVTSVSTTVFKPIYAFQPTNPSINRTNAQGYLVQLPTCTISNNPYGGDAGPYGLINCVAIKYGGVSAVVWFYEPPGGQGVLLAYQSKSYPQTPVARWVPWLYVGTNGYLYAKDWSTSQISTPISPGWHMAVVEGWAASTSGPYYIALYLDGQYIGQVSTNTLLYLFGYGWTAGDNIGTGFTLNYPSTNGGWFFFNGTIAWVAIYNTVLSQSQVQQLYIAGFPNTLFSDNLVVAYYLSPSYYDSNGYYFVPYYVNSAILSQLGIGSANAISITPAGSVGAIPSSQFMQFSTPFKYLVGNGVVYTISNATGMDADKMFTPAVNYAQGFASVFALIMLIGLVVGFIWTRRR